MAQKKNRKLLAHFFYIPKDVMHRKRWGRTWEKTVGISSSWENPSMCKLPDTLELKHPSNSGERRKKGTQSLCYQQDTSDSTMCCLMSHDKTSLHAFLLTIGRAVPCWESAPGIEILFTKLTRWNFKSCADSAKRARLSEEANLRLLTADNRGLA